MNTRLIRELDRMDEKKRKVFDLINKVRDEHLLHQIHPGTWSPLQVINHLYLSEKLSLAYLRKKLSYPETVPLFHPKSWLGFYKVRGILLIPVKVKAPKAIDMWSNQEVLSPDELERKWTVLREEMRRYIMEAAQKFPDHLVYNHPFGGRLTLLQMLMFFNDHIAHHTRQMKRILRLLRKMPVSLSDS